MKINKFYFVAAFSLVMSACTQSEVVENGNLENENVLLAEFANDNSRVSLDGLNLSWSEGDQFKVVSDASSILDFSLTDAAKGEFTSKDKFDGKMMYAAFPSQYVSNMIKAGSDEAPTYTGWYNLPTRYAAGESLKNFPLRGQVKGGTVLVNHLMTLLKLTVNNLPAEATGIELSATNTRLGGYYRTNLKDSEAVLKVSEVSPDGTNVDEQYKSDHAKYLLQRSGTGSKEVFYIALPAKEYESFEVVVLKSPTDYADEKGNIKRMGRFKAKFGGEKKEMARQHIYNVEVSISEEPKN